MANTQPGSASARDLPVAALHEVPGRKLNDEDVWVRDEKVERASTYRT